jgi:hypothetical protein
MKKYKIVHYYDYSLETVAKLLMDNETPLYDLVDLPNVSQNKLLDERVVGDKKYIKVEWCVHGQMPPIVQKVIKPNMLTFVEESVWDRTTKVYTTKIIPHFFRNQIDAHHKVEFFDNGDGRTRRVLSGVFEIKIPIIGAIFEGLVLTYLKQNCEDDYKLSVRALKQYIEKNGDPFADKGKKKK